MSSYHNKYPCPKCEEMADRIKRRLTDRVVSLFKPVKRYKCHFCDWTDAVPDKIDDEQRQALPAHAAQVPRHPGPVADLFDKSCGDADRAAPERCAHTLKGTAGNIGARGVQAAAGHLERACREHAPEAQLQALLRETLPELAPVIDGLQALDVIKQPGTAVMAEVDPAKLKALSLHLQALLRDDDAQARLPVGGERSLVKSAFPAPWPRIAQSLGGFNEALKA